MLAPGTRIGPYEVAAQIGVGGMGEVYRATDTNLRRAVALKVLPAAVAGDAERLARFQREAEVLAALNHPNIAAIYGLERGEGPTALVMELVEGPTLADRIAPSASHGARPTAEVPTGGLPVDEVLAIARQIAEALAAAHERGIVHRDLKPANIKVRLDGTVKVLDFGLAKALTPEAAGSAAGGASQLPTITSPALMTAAGAILGTAAYMSPEQARGHVADARSDVWAFGCVLYEMLTGARAFPGHDVVDTLAAVVRAEPDWSLLPSDVPSPVRTLLERCLEKDWRRRVASISTALFVIEESRRLGASGQAAVNSSAQAQQAAASASAHAARSWMMRGAVAAVGLAAAVALGLSWRTAPRARETLVRSLVSVAPAEQLSGANTFEQEASLRRPTRVALALSPDGTTLVFSGRAQGKQQLYVRPLDQLTASPIPGTEGAEHPFFSPDGQWVAFWADGQIQKLPLGGGPAVTICKSGLLFGASWGPDGTIVFAGGRNVGLSRVSAAGGVPTGLTSPKDGEYSHRLPHVTPDGRSVVFTIQRAPITWETSQVVIRSLATGDQRVLVEGGADGQVLPTGHLVYARLGTLMAVAFDAERQAVSGDPAGVVDDLMQAANGGNFVADTGAAQLSFAAVGTMAYAVGGVFPDEATEVVIRNRSGERTIVPLQPRRYSLARYSPDASRLVLTTTGGATGALSRQLWVLEPARGTVSPVSTDAASSYAIWSPDGNGLAYRASVGAVDNLFRKDLLSGALERLTTSPRNETPISWTPDGKTLFYTVENDVGGTAIDIWTVSLPDKSTRAVVATKANETTPEISPDGRWLLYTSNASGRDDVYVQPFPGPGEPVQISIGGGKYPLWARSGHEILYFEEPLEGTGAAQLWAVPVSLGPALSLGQRRALFKASVRLAGPSRAWDLSPDGQSIISTESLPQAVDTNAATIVLVQHWFNELRQRVPSSAPR